MLQDAALWLDERPYKEIYDGRIHPKVSPRHEHSIVQATLAALILDWGRERGDTGTEWRVYLNENTSLVPDVSFISDQRLASLSDDQVEKPPFAPDLTVEVRSPDKRERAIHRKTQLYLQHGAVVVLDVDPETRLIRVTTQEGETTLKTGETFAHPAFPGLILPVDAIFAPLDRRR